MYFCNLTDLRKCLQNFWLSLQVRLKFNFSRINLPVVGSLSSASAGAKPLLLDCFFPFDPYILDESRVYVSEIYRPFAGEVFDEDDLSQNDEEDDVETGDESDEESNETPDSGLGRRRQRKDSMR